MIVMKFGGTSVQDVPAMTRALQDVTRRLERRPVVVLSAMGKTTNRLLEIADWAHQGEVERAQKLSHELHEYHLEVARGLLDQEAFRETRAVLEGYFGEIGNIIRGLYLLGELTPRSKDALASYGERMSTLIFARALHQQGTPAELLDSRQFMRTDREFTRATVLQDLAFPLIREHVTAVVQRHAVPVLQGFIGSTMKGITTTIGRGGGDLSAALVGAALEVEDIQIWTDVPGVLTGDPRLVRPVYKIRVISFNEASELAYFGAKVLHPSTLLPAIRRNIPVHVCSSSRIEAQGTLISATAVASKNPVKSIACKRGITLLNVVSTRMLLAFGFLRRIFEVFDRHRTVVDAVATSEVSVSLTIDSTEKLEAIVEDLSEFGEVTVESGVAILCVVGDNLGFTPGIAGRIFTTLTDINVRLISQGASRINVTFIVQEDRMEEAVRRLHQEFFQDPDPNLFEKVS